MKLGRRGLIWPSELPKLNWHRESTTTAASLHHLRVGNQMSACGLLISAYFPNAEG